MKANSVSESRWPVSGASDPPAASVPSRLMERAATGLFLPGSHSSRAGRGAAPPRHRPHRRRPVRPRCGTARSRSGSDARAQPVPPADTTTACGPGARCGASAAPGDRPGACAISAAGVCCWPRAADPSAWNLRRRSFSATITRETSTVCATNMLSERRRCVPLSQTSAIVARPSKRNLRVDPSRRLRIGNGTTSPRRRSRVVRSRSHRPAARSAAATGSGPSHVIQSGRSAASPSGAVAVPGSAQAIAQTPSSGWAARESEDGGARHAVRPIPDAPGRYIARRVPSSSRPTPRP